MVRTKTLSQKAEAALADIIPISTTPSGSAKAHASALIARTNRISEKIKIKIGIITVF